MKQVLIFTLFLLFVGPLFSQSNDEPVGKSAPNFRLETLDGKAFELNKVLGKGPVLLSFWATWCKPCLEEMTEFQKIYSAYKDKGFNLIAISTDAEKTVAKVKPYIKSKGYDFTVLLDTNSDVARKYYAQQIPYTVLLDKNGKIVYSHLGYMRGDEKKVEELIAGLIGK